MKGRPPGRPFCSTLFRPCDSRRSARMGLRRFRARSRVLFMWRTLRVREAGNVGGVGGPPAPRTSPRGPRRSRQVPNTTRSGTTAAGVRSCLPNPGGATQMRKKIFIAGLLVASTGGAWAAGGRMGIQDTARYVVDSIRTNRELRAASGNGAQTTFPEIGVTNASGNIVFGASPDSVGDGAVLWQSAAGLPKGLLLVSAQGAGQVAVFNTAGAPRVIPDGNAGLQSPARDLAERVPARAQLTTGN